MSMRAAFNNLPKLLRTALIHVFTAGFRVLEDNQLHNAATYKRRGYVYGDPAACEEQRSLDDSRATTHRLMSNARAAAGILDIKLPAYGTCLLIVGTHDNGNNPPQELPDYIEASIEAYKRDVARMQAEGK